MLHAGKFSGSTTDLFNAGDYFRAALSASVRTLSHDGNYAVKHQFHRKAEGKQATVQFLDTKDRQFRRNHLIVRRRQPIQEGPLEFTLKRRHPDRFLVSGSRIGGRKRRFEEDIKFSGCQQFISLYSLSGKAFRSHDEDSEAGIRTVKDVRKLFPQLRKALGEQYHGKAGVLRVCDFTAVQTVLEGVYIRLTKDVQAECALIVWHELGADPASPAVAEFSFRFPDPNSGRGQESFSEELSSCALKLFYLLQDPSLPIASWIWADGLTKTAYAYNRTRTDC